jgi:hypothetical protein
MHIRNGRVMVPLYAARIEDLGPVEFMVVECHSCNVGLLSARFLLSLGFPPYTSIKSLQRHTRCRGCGVRGRGDNLDPAGEGGGLKCKFDQGLA